MPVADSCGHTPPCPPRRYKSQNSLRPTNARLRAPEIHHPNDASLRHRPPVSYSREPLACARIANVRIKRKNSARDVSCTLLSVCFRETGTPSPKTYVLNVKILTLCPSRAKANQFPPTLDPCVTTPNESIQHSACLASHLGPADETPSVTPDLLSPTSLLPRRMLDIHHTTHRLIAGPARATTSVTRRH